MRARHRRRDVDGVAGFGADSQLVLTIESGLALIDDALLGPGYAVIAQRRLVERVLRLASHRPMFVVGAMSTLGDYLGEARQMGEALVVGERAVVIAEEALAPDNQSRLGAELSLVSRYIENKRDADALSRLDRIRPYLDPADRSTERDPAGVDLHFEYARAYQSRDPRRMREHLARMYELAALFPENAEAKATLEKATTLFGKRR